MIAPKIKTNICENDAIHIRAGRQITIRIQSSDWHASSVLSVNIPSTSFFQEATLNPHIMYFPGVNLHVPTHVSKKYSDRCSGCSIDG